jgi:hypothetical protein
MKLDGPLPDHFLSKLPPEERKKLGRAGMTSEEAQASYVARSEKALQLAVSEWLRAQKYPFFSPRFDKRTTWQIGAPDFVVCVEGFFVCVECKSLHGKLSKEQEAIMSYVTMGGGMYLVIHEVEELAKALLTTTREGATS